MVNKPRCIYYDVDDVRAITFSPVTCDHPASITRLCSVGDHIESCPLLLQRYFMYNILTTDESTSCVEIMVSATFPPWSNYELTYSKDATLWENGRPIKFNNRITDAMLKGIISDFSKEKYQHVKLININN